MTLAVGDRLGPYQILSLLGAGGMGELYRAKDTRVDRIVAIKVLPNPLAESHARQQRLEREARAIARLSHPHICAFVDVGEKNGARFLVMEYVEGETLARRLSRGPLPVSEAVRYGIEIADALDHAHREGFVHRDLKPANIMLTGSGSKLLDFGLAKVLKRDDATSTSSVTSASGRTTSTETLTEDGTILGTVQYMAPEQLEGNEADARTDIFAFGAVVYEMVSGRRAFAGASKASVIAAILERDPEPLAARTGAGVGRSEHTVSPLLDHVIARCLAKKPEERWQTAADLKRELKWAATPDVAAEVPRPLERRDRLPDRALIVATTVLLVTTLALAAMVYRSVGDGPVASPVVRFSFLPPEGTAMPSGPAGPHVAVSPDGRTLAFAAGESLGKLALWIQPFESLSPEKLPGTDDARYPFWSPDSQSIGFFAHGKLKTVRLTGEPPRTLTDAAEAEGGAWGTQDVIVFAPMQRAGLYRIAAGGGAATPVTILNEARQDYVHGWPSFLPDGRRFLFIVKSARSEHTGIYVGSLDSNKHVRLAGSNLRASYAAPGYLLFGHEGTLMAQPFDTNRLRLTGEAVAVEKGLAHSNGNGRMSFSVSDTGVLAHRPGGAGGARVSHLKWFDRVGNHLETLGTPGFYLSLTSSPASDIVAAMRGGELWLFDLVRGAARQSPVGDGIGSVAWAPDGRRVAYSTQRGAGQGIYEKFVSGAAPATLLSPSTEFAQHVTSWSPDGRFILYDFIDRRTAVDIWVLPLTGDRKPKPYLQTTANESHARFSPDGRWVAYCSNDSGRYDVYVQSFPTPGVKWRVSTSGGFQPVWRQDGQELFYLDPDNNLVAVEIKGGNAFETGVSRPLFKTPLRSSLVLSSGNQYVAAADGQRFLLKLDQDEKTPITVVLNWMAALNQSRGSALEIRGTP